MNFLQRTALLLLPSLVAGCYPLHATMGHLDLMARRQPVEALVADPAMPGAYKARLKRAAAMRDFASRELALPDNGSYRQYARLSEDYPVWSVWVTPEFELEPRQSCFPVSGCVPYRGYYSREAAGRYAADFRAAGDDVLVGGVTAYSTLGYFDDPLTTAMLRLPDERLAGLIFHELAHQVVYVKDDATFNESFARAVEIEGTLRWLAQRQDTAGLAAYRASLARADSFFESIKATRAELAELYASPLDAAAKRQGKARIFEALREAQRRRVALDSAWSTYDPWFDGELNNARLAAVATYFDEVGNFRELLAAHGGDFSAFYSAVRSLARHPR
ncbi:MAG: aminopeptidase [Gammaproteobacteria bacterium]